MNNSAQLREPEGKLCNAPDQVVDFGYGAQVFFQGRLLATTFNSEGAAQAYLDGLKKGRQPV